MDSTARRVQALQDRPTPVRAKLAAAWTSFLFLSVYVDVLGETWMYYYTLALGLEGAVLAYVLRCAWRWPRTTAISEREVVPARTA